MVPRKLQKEREERGRELPSFKLFCTEAFQFDYEAPFHRAWMLRAIQNESEPLADWTGSLPVCPLWWHQGITRATLDCCAPLLHCVVRLCSWLSEQAYGGDWVLWDFGTGGKDSCCKVCEGLFRFTEVRSQTYIIVFCISLTSICWWRYPLSYFVSGILSIQFFYDVY